MSKLKKYGQHIALSVLLLALGVFGIYQFYRAEELEYAQNITYRQIFTELTGYVDDMETGLLKARLISDPRQLVNLSGELYRSSEAAKASLCALPLGETSVARTTEFLSQVGDFAHSVSMRVLGGGEITEDDVANIESLSQSARGMQQGLDELLVQMNNGNINFKNVSKRVSGGSGVALADSISDMEEELHDYPSLVYDGPFSQHVSEKAPVYLANKTEVDESMAKSIAELYIGSAAALLGEGEGKIASYYFESGSKKAEITKAGGHLLWLLNNRRIGEKTLELEQAKQYAADFLRKNGFPDMTESYYDIKDDCAVINYAWSQNGYIVYPDMVKVKVALDNGEIVGFEGRGYIMNHTPRQIPQPRITAEQALALVSSAAPVESVGYAVIPLDSGDEAFCYQLRGTVDDRHFLIYINTQTGAEEDIMILLETDTGVLAV